MFASCGVGGGPCSLQSLRGKEGKGREWKGRCGFEFQWQTAHVGEEVQGGMKNLLMGKGRRGWNETGL